MDYYNNPIVWHPHNMFLQLWLDTGFLGVLVITFLLLLGWRAAIRFSVSSRPAILAGLMMLTVFTLVTHSLWQTWSMAMISFVIVQISLLTAPAGKA
jgi:O-antigen ligase